MFSITHNIAVDFKYRCVYIKPRVTYLEGVVTLPLISIELESVLTLPVNFMVMSGGHIF